MGVDRAEHVVKDSVFTFLMQDEHWFTPEELAKYAGSENVGRLEPTKYIMIPTNNQLCWNVIFIVGKME